MSESRLRMIKQLSSSIFSSEKESKEFKPSKKMTRDLSDSFTYGSYRNSSPSSPYLKPIDHKKSDLFGNFPSDFYRKDIHGTYNSPSCQQKKPETFDKITNRLVLNQSRASSKSRVLNSSYIAPIPKAQKPEEAKLETISITGLPSNHDEVDIKNLCKGIHLVNISTEIDNFTGKFLGKATVSVRSNSSRELENLKMKLVNEGYKISAISAKVGKKNNFHTAGINFLNSKLQQEEKRLVGNSLSCKERKMALLASSQDLFGNSGSFFNVNTDRTAEVKEDRKNQESFRMWQMTKNLCVKSPSTCRSFSLEYSRPTISSSNKIRRAIN